VIYLYQKNRTDQSIIPTHGGSTILKALAGLLQWKCVKSFPVFGDDRSQPISVSIRTASRKRRLGKPSLPSINTTRNVKLLSFIWRISQLKFSDCYLAITSFSFYILRFTRTWCCKRKWKSIVL